MMLKRLQGLWKERGLNGKSVDFPEPPWPLSGASGWPRTPAMQALVLALSVLIQGCNSPRDSGSIWVAVPWVVGSQNEERVIELTDLQSLKELRSEQIQIFLKPRLREDASLYGESPKIEVMKDSRGYWVGLNAQSVTLMSIYAFFSELRRELASLGEDRLLSKAFSVGFLQSSDIGGQEPSNAFYFGRSSFLFLNDGDARAPLGLNPGVLAHEFFHHVFEEISISEGNSPLIGVESRSGDLIFGSSNYLFGGALPSFRLDFDRLWYLQREDLRGLSVAGAKPTADRTEKENLAFNSELYLALQEGLADIWAWLFTAHVNFVPLSLPNVLQERSLEVSGPELGILSHSRFMEIFFGAQSSGEHALASWKYAMGSYFAREIFRNSQKMQQAGRRSWDEYRRELALSILQACRRVSRMRAIATQSGTRMDPFVFLRALQEAMPGLQLGIPDPPESKSTKSLGSKPETNS